ncbi:MAG: 5'/3'-nucleotidase SurE [Desulfobulbaceae bacterium]|nr:5'/3'-nucleotidase SurE [Desulfobulbaceae bacterium]
MSTEEKQLQQQEEPLILVTNDDGVHAPGLRMLFEAMKSAGNPVIVAPDRDNSAVSHSLTLNRPLRVIEIEPNIFAINGTPADCVTIGVEKVLGRRPDLVVSGINAGANLGHDISYSGTVSAAKEGTIRGVPSMALSMSGEPPYLYETAVNCALGIVDILLESAFPKDCYLNINVPNLAQKDISGIKITKQGRRIYENALQELPDPWGRPCFWIGGGSPSKDRVPGTDSFEIKKNAISITPIHLDLTHYEALSFLQDALK